MYAFILLAVVVSIKNFYVLRFKQLYTLNSKYKILLIINFISLGGLPPFLGFLIKISVLKSMSGVLSNMVSIMLVFLSLYIIYFYISRFVYMSRNSPNIKVRVNQKLFWSPIILFALRLVLNIYILL